MTGAALYLLLADVDEHCVNAAYSPTKKSAQSWIKWIAAAACLCVILASLLPRLPNYDAPYQVNFQSSSDLDTLIHAEQLSDEDLEEYLQEKGFSERLLRTRNDVENMVAPLRKVGYPSAEGAFSLSWLPGYRYDFIYAIDGVQYGFYYTATEKQPLRIGLLSVAPFNIGGKTVRFYPGTKGIVGEFYAEGYQVRITVRGYKNLEDISFDRFLWKIP